MHCAKPESRQAHTAQDLPRQFFPCLLGLQPQRWCPPPHTHTRRALALPAASIGRIAGRALSREAGSSPSFGIHRRPRPARRLEPR